MKLTHILLCIILIVSPTLAWNRAGHMVSGAIVYQTLKLEHPETIKKVMALLQQYPDYPHWENAVGNLPDQEQNHDFFVFMLAAKWADEIRDNPTFNHPKWHYINYPITFDNTPTNELEAENIVSAFTENYAKLTKPDAAATDKAVSLTWLFPLVGDVQQPLHATSLFSAEFPDGDRGGNAFTGIASEGAKTINLHTFWDGLIIGSENFREVTNRAIPIRNNPNLQRSRLAELKEQNFFNWANVESVNLAREVVYQNGALKTNSTLSQEYRDKAKEVGERRIALAGYRLADALVKAFENSAPLISNPPTTNSPFPVTVSAPIYGNHRSMIYHLRIARTIRTSRHRIGWGLRPKRKPRRLVSERRRTARRDERKSSLFSLAGLPYLHSVIRYSKVERSISLSCGLLGYSAMIFKTGDFLWLELFRRCLTFALRHRTFNFPM